MKKITKSLFVCILLVIGCFYQASAQPKKAHLSKHRSTQTPVVPRITYHLSPALTYTESVPFTSTRGQWYKVNASGGYIHFKDVAVSASEFSTDISIDGACIIRTTKPVRVDFAVTVFDSAGDVVGRGTSSIYNVQDMGGEYVLTGPTIIPDPDKTPTACDIRAAGIWTTK